MRRLPATNWAVSLPSIKAATNEARIEWLDPSGEFEAQGRGAVTPVDLVFSPGKALYIERWTNTRKAWPSHELQYLSGGADVAALMAKACRRIEARRSGAASQPHGGFCRKACVSHAAHFGTG